MRTNKCHKCSRLPKRWRTGRLVVVKCPACGQTVTALGTRVAIHHLEPGPAGIGAGVMMSVCDAAGD
jgi:hypothetical protein